MSFATIRIVFDSWSNIKIATCLTMGLSMCYLSKCCTSILLFVLFVFSNNYATFAYCLMMVPAVVMTAGTFF